MRFFNEIAAITDEVKFSNLQVVLLSVLIRLWMIIGELKSGKSDGFVGL